jgi:hypothetical protein
MILGEIKRMGYLNTLLDMLRDYQDTVDQHLKREFRTAEWPHSKREFMRLARLQGRAQAPLDIIRTFSALSMGSAAPPPDEDFTPED